MIEIIVLLLIVMFCLPFMIYVSVKLGTYAHYRGRQLFENERKRSDGEKPRGTKEGVGPSQG